MVRRPERIRLQAKPTAVAALSLSNSGQTFRRCSIDRGAEGATEGSAAADSDLDSGESSPTSGSPWVREGAVDSNICGAARGPAHGFADGFAGFLSYVWRSANPKSVSNLGLSRSGSRPARWNLHVCYASERLARNWAG